MARSTTKSARSAGKAGADRTVIGITRDGVKILKPPGKPTHFTAKELRDAVASVFAAKQAG